MFNGLEGFLVPFMNPEMVALVGIGVFVGVYMAAIPGMSVTMAVSILISFTFSWDIYPALAVMMGIYVGGVYGGARSAILMNIPGAPASVAAGFDGYPLAKMGLAGEAMGLSTTQACIGMFLGLVCFALGAPIIAQFALHFAPRDYFLLAFMGLFLIGSLSEDGSVTKAMMTACVGILIGLTGMDPVTGQPRLTFGTNELLGGVHFIIVMIGTFGISETLVQLQTNVLPVKQKIGRVRPTWEVIKKNIPLTVRSAFIGVTIGVLPGAGGDIAALMAYDNAKRTVKDPFPMPFGQGAYQGLIAPETACEAAIGGDMTPMMTLGIPGDSVTAVLIGALMVHGLRPGPMLMREQPEFFWVIVALLLIANIALYVVGMTGIGIFSKIVEIPKAIILPMIVIMTMIGGYSMGQSIADIYWLIFFGILCYFMKRYGYPVAGVVLGVILTPIIDNNFRRGVAMEQGDALAFFLSFFTNTIALVLIGISVLTVVVSSPQLEGFRKKLFGRE